MLSFKSNLQDSPEPLGQDQLLGLLKDDIMGFNANRVVQAFLFELSD